MSLSNAEVLSKDIELKRSEKARLAGFEMPYEGLWSSYCRRSDGESEPHQRTAATYKF